jgi:hypothetical protein
MARTLRSEMLRLRVRTSCGENPHVHMDPPRFRTAGLRARNHASKFCCSVCPLVATKARRMIFSRTENPRFCV